jgi:hypothetical protein
MPELSPPAEPTGEPRRPPEILRKRVSLATFGDGSAYSLIYEGGDEPCQNSPVQIYEEDEWHGDYGGPWAYQPTKPSLPNDSPGWVIPGVVVVPHVCRPAVLPPVLHVSAAQQRQLASALLWGLHPTLTLKSTAYVQRLRVKSPYPDYDYWWQSDFEMPPHVEIVRIDDVMGVEDDTKPSDERTILIYDGDDEDRSAWSGNRRLSLHEDQRPPMPLDTPYWVIPGVLKVELSLRRIPSANCSHVGEEFVFAKPNGDIIAFNKKMAKAEPKGAEGTARKASAKRYREADDAPAGVGKGE